jgi:hypothetical protein
MGRQRLVELDDLLLRLRDLVLVRDVLEQRGTAVDELDVGIRRITEQLSAGASATS